MKSCHYLHAVRVPCTSARAGSTLLEMAIALGVFSVIMGTVGSAMSSLQGGLSEGTVSAVSEEAARRVLERVVEELGPAQLSSLTLSQPTDARAVTFSVIQGWGGAVPNASAARTLAFSAGQLTLDGQVLSGELADLTLNLNGSLLTIYVRVDKTAVVGGDSRTISAEHTARLQL